MEQIKSENFFIELLKENSNIKRFKIDIDGDIIAIKDFQVEINLVREILNLNSITQNKYRQSWIDFISDNTPKLKDFIVRNINKVYDDPKFKLLIWKFFQFCETVFHSVGTVLINKRKWNEAFWFYNEVLNSYELILRFINNSLEEKGRKLSFNDVKWGVPLCNLGISLLNKGNFERGLAYMLAADYNDKNRNSNYVGLAHRIIWDQIFPTSMQMFYKNAVLLRDLYAKNGIDLTNSILENDEKLNIFLRTEINSRYLLNIFVNFEKIYRWDYRFINSDYSFTMQYIFNILINLTYIIEVWLKDITGQGSSDLDNFRHLVMNHLPDFNNSFYIPKTSDFNDGLEFSEHLEKFYNNCFLNNGELVDNLDVVHYSLSFIISIRNFSHHNFYDDIPNLKHELFIYRLIDGFIIGILAWLDATKRYIDERSRNRSNFDPDDIYNIGALF